MSDLEKNAGGAENLESTLPPPKTTMEGVVDSNIGRSSRNAVLVGAITTLSSGAADLHKNPLPTYDKTPQEAAAHNVAKQLDVKNMTPEEFAKEHSKRYPQALKKEEAARRKPIIDKVADAGKVGAYGTTLGFGASLLGGFAGRRRREIEEVKSENPHGRG
ncbi:MAG: hypothetical protein R3D71_02535 [Rickettsiales bacterium]